MTETGGYPSRRGDLHLPELQDEKERARQIADFKMIDSCPELRDEKELAWQIAERRSGERGLAARQVLR